jgi:opacity protein-like surface antigen
MKKLILTSVALLGMNPLLQAHALQDSWFIGAAAGATFPQVEGDSLVSGMGWPYDRYTNDSISSVAQFSLFGGFNWVRDSVWIPFYSLHTNYTSTLSSDVEGNILQFSLPEFNNYSYKYSVQSQVLLETLKVDLYRYQNFMPFVSAGIGAAWNKVKDYDEHAFPGITARINPDFGPRSNASFAYSFAAGLDYIFSDYVWLSLQYHYSHLGHANTGRSGIYNNEKIETTLTSNNVMLSITCFLEKVL